MRDMRLCSGFMNWLKLDRFFALDKAGFSALLSMGDLGPVGQPTPLFSLETATTLRAATFPKRFKLQILSRHLRQGVQGAAGPYPTGAF
ncbi:hypothetical protein [Roseovarius lutimaris]|uniref:hypothetical protein n=1 Tax=Roseovarius lutimaris TaxID=1005928 RepID=UPI001160D321|nr:hypothetical protein [Roseovarius lutimaris]